MVRACLSRDANIYYPSSKHFGRSPIYLAARSERANVGTVAELLECGALVHPCHTLKAHPLVAAANQECLGTMAVLQAWGASDHYLRRKETALPEPTQRSALVAAASTGKLRSVRYLLKHFPSTRDPKIVKLALAEAVRNSNTAVLTRLLKVASPEIQLALFNADCPDTVLSELILAERDSQEQAQSSGESDVSEESEESVECEEPTPSPGTGF